MDAASLRLAAAANNLRRRRAWHPLDDEVLRDEFRKLWQVEPGDEAALWRREQLVEIKLEVQRKVRENPYRPAMPGAREELERRLDALAERRRLRVGGE
jgi:hypothetical protein